MRFRIDDKAASSALDHCLSRPVTEDTRETISGHRVGTVRIDPMSCSHGSARPLLRRSMAKRDVVFPAGRQALYEKNRYSPAIRANGFLFVSGQVGSRPDGSPEPDLEAQVRLAFDNLNAILSAAGCTSTT